MKSWIIRYARRWAMDALFEWLLDQPLRIRIPQKYRQRLGPDTLAALTNLEHELSTLRYKLIRDIKEHR